MGEISGGDLFVQLSEADLQVIDEFVKRLVFMSKVWHRGRAQPLLKGRNAGERCCIFGQLL